MNGFKLYKVYKGSDINFKILYKVGDDIVLELVLSYPNIDIWNNNDKDEFSNTYYKKIYLHRDEWQKICAYQSVNQVIKDFDDAIEEFKKVDDFNSYTTAVNKYLMKQIKAIVDTLNK